MAEEKLFISYPSISPGTKKSEISFISGVPNLNSIFEHDSNSDKPDDKAYIGNTPRRFFVTDVTVSKLDCMSDFISKFNDGAYGDDRLIILESGEHYKTIESVLKIVTAAVNAGFTRNDVFVGIGGGVVCDITSFAASIFKRGASVQLIPTTLLAMVDASIGGKTGCDFDNYKNIIGTFFPASKIFIFPEFVDCLPENQYNSGLAEAFKTALLFDKKLYNLFKDNADKINRRDKYILEFMIKRCVAEKCKIVEQDFTEKGIRATLNLGHTFGHALETVAGLGSITHGYAVAWGIGRSVELAYKKNYCVEAFRDEVFEILKKYGWATGAIPKIVIGERAGERLIFVMHNDKKNITNKVRLIIQKGVCDTVIEETDDQDILSVLK